MNYEKLIKTTKEEIEAGINDGLGGIYSQDGKRLLKYANTSEESYIVKDGTQVICNDAFTTYDTTYKLRHLSLPDSLVAIGSSAFKWLFKLSKINLPSQLKYIGDNAFDGCKSLRKITLPPSLSILGVQVFFHTRGNLKIVSDSPAFKAEDGILLTADGSRLLLVKTNAERFIIPPSVKVIDNEAFDAPNLSYLTIPANVDKIGIQYFEQYDSSNLKVLAILNPDLKFEEYDWIMPIDPGVGIKVIFVPEGRGEYFSKYIEHSAVIQELRPTEYNYLLQPDFDYRKAISNEATYSEDGKTLLKYRGTGLTYDVKPGTEVIAHEAFKGNFCLEYIHFPDTLAKIEYGAFDYCWFLQELVLPDSVEVIEDKAFHECGNLEFARLSPNLRKIGEQAFEGCKYLKEINIPDGITTIGNQAFGRCQKLWYVRLPNTLVELQGFNECEHLTKIEVPSSVKVIKKGAFQGSNIRELIIPEGLEEIESNAFEDCWLTDVNLPDSVKIIGDNAFKGSCIHRINIPPHAILGNYNPFEGSSVKIDCQNPDYRLVDDVLYTADSKKIIAYLSPENEFHVPETVEVIGNGAFAGQIQLQKIYITQKIEIEDSLVYVYGRLHIPEDLKYEYIDIIAYQRHCSVTDLQTDSTHISSTSVI